MCVGARERFVHERRVIDHLAAARAGIGGDDQDGRGVVDARRQTRRRKAAEHDRMDRAEPRAGEHREQGFGDHRQIDQDALAFMHAERAHHRGHAVHFGVQFGVGVAPLDARFRRYIHQRILLSARGEMAVDRVVAEIGLAADEPARKRRIASVEHLIERRFPVDAPRLFAPRTIPALRSNGGELSR